jgi:hypothetical protein
MKKKTLPAIIPTGDTVVNNSINMNFNQNDLLDLVIQEKIDQLETQLEILRQGVKNDYTSHCNAMLKQLLDTNPKAYGDFTSTVAKLGVLPKDFTFVHIYSGRIAKSDSDPIFSFKQSNYGHHRDTRKNPLEAFVAGTYDTKITISRIQNITFSILARTKDGIDLQKAHIYKLTKTQSEFLFKKEVLFAQVYSDLCNEKYAVEKELLKYTHQEKKIKAQFTKAYLAKSSQGKDIIKLLEKATKVNLSLE